MRRLLYLAIVVFGAVLFYYWYVLGENLLFEQQRQTDIALYTYATRLPADRVSTREPGPRWEQAAAMPSLRTRVAGAALGGRIYIVGGLDSFGRDTDAMDVFNVQTNTWSKSVPLPRALHDPVMVALHGSVYVFGGFEGLVEKPLDTVFRYDPAVAEWRQLAAMPEAAGGMAAALDGDSVILAGGTTAIGATPAVWRYDAAKDTWAPMEDMLTSRERLGAVMLDGTLLAFGGREGSAVYNTGRLETFKAVNKFWERKANMPAPRSAFGTAVVADRVFVFGGEAATAVFGSVLTYDADADAWTTVAEMPTPRYGAATVESGGKIFVIGGSPRPGFSVSDVVEVFVP